MVLFQDAIPPHAWRDLYYRVDRHLTPLGNQRLAEAVFPSVRALAASATQ